MLEDPTATPVCPMCGAAPQPADEECCRCGERLRAVQRPDRFPEDPNSAGLALGLVLAAITLPICVPLVAVSVEMESVLALAVTISIVLGASAFWLMVVWYDPRQQSSAEIDTTAGEDGAAN